MLYEGPFRSKSVNIEPPLRCSPPPLKSEAVKTGRQNQEGDGGPTRVPSPPAEGQVGLQSNVQTEHRTTALWLTEPRPRQLDSDV